MGVGTPRRRPARTTPPATASSSEGRPAATSRAVEVVSAGGKDSMMLHCSANVV